MKLPNAQQAAVSERKVVAYLLNPGTLYARMKKLGLQRPAVS